MRICIIEDESSIALPLQQTLEKNGFAVDCVFDGEKGLFLLRANQYDCILLDINLPGLNGLELTKKIREARNNTPIIMLTARVQIYDKVEGFEYGADDYVTKPFHLNELLARIRAVIKRSSENKSMGLQFGPYTLFPQKNMVEMKQGDRKQEIVLTSKETSILEYLLRHPERIISPEEILEHVWDREVNLFTDSVKTHIKTLRQKIDPEKNLIETFRGKGYKITL